MRSFELEHAESFEEASRILASEKAEAMAGGTDLLNVYKQGILEKHPDKVIDLKRIPDAAGISCDKEQKTVTIKALTTLTNVAESQVVPTAISEAARSVASPLIRNLGTFGGNICQDVRCWYYRYPHEAGGRMMCERKGGDLCYSIHGDNRYHSIFGGMKAGANACAQNCPAGTDIPAYMAKLRAGDWDGAAEIIMRVNPMPMITSRICPHPCQDACNQNNYGDPVSIHCVERSVGDYILAHADKFYRAPEKKTGKKTAIIGAGPSGLSAAYYLRKAGHAVTVYDSHEKAGGVLQYGIPRYRLPREIVDRFTGALEKMGVEFRMKTEVGRDITMDAIVDGYDSVFVGTGAWRQPILGIAGESLTEFGLNFLVEVNTFLKETIKDSVLVCGGGNVAMDVALTARRLGAKKVQMVCLEQRSKMPASEEEIARAEEEGITISNGWGLKSVVTDDQGRVSGLESKKCVSIRDEEGHFSPKYDETITTVYPADTIILATGQRVDLSFLGDNFGKQLKTNRGLMSVDPETYQTKIVKIYAGGDAQTGPNIAIRAIHAGCAAAHSMSRSMGVESSVAKEDSGFLTFDVQGVQKTEGAKQKELPLAERNLVSEDAQSLTAGEAREEACRCMNCGCYSVNASDLSPVLVALDSTIVTTKKEIPASRFFTTKLKATDMLDRGELVKEVRVPDMEGYVTGYRKSRIRDAIDFALYSVAFAYRIREDVIDDVKLAAGGVAPVPIRLTEVEEYLKGKKPTEKTAAEAGRIAISHAVPMSKNEYKINGLETMISRIVMGMK